MQVMHVNAVFDHVESEVVALADRDPGLDAPARHPHREGVGVMVPAIVRAALDHRSATEFAAPQHQRVVKQPALLQVLHERCRGLVRVLAILAQA